MMDTVDEVHAYARCLEKLNPKSSSVRRQVSFVKQRAKELDIPLEIKPDREYIRQQQRLAKLYGW